MCAAPSIRIHLRRCSYSLTRTGAMCALYGGGRGGAAAVLAPAARAASSPLLRPIMAAAAAVMVVTAAAAAAGNGTHAEHGGGACATDWDCSLGGLCRHNASSSSPVVDSGSAAAAAGLGRCVCDVWFTGPSCRLLNLQPARPVNGLDYEGWSSWGGHAVSVKRGPKGDRQWYGFFSLMAERCTLGAYRSNSGSVAATSVQVDGPYAVREATQPDAAANWAVAPPSHCTQVKYHAPSGQYHLWHILPGNGDGQYRNCSARGSSGGGGVHNGGAAVSHGGSDSGAFSQNLWVHTAPTPHGPWSKVGTQINVTDLKHNTTAVQSWCSAPYYYPNGSALLVWSGQQCPNGGGCIWAGVADSWGGPYRQVQAAPISEPGFGSPAGGIEDPAIFRDPRGNLHMLTNANSGHVHCQAGGACGGHSWSRDGLAWSPVYIGAFGPVTKVDNGSTVNLGYVERPQVAQEAAGTPPLALFLGTGYTHRSFTWAQRFCDDVSLAAGRCGYMGGVSRRSGDDARRRLKMDDSSGGLPAPSPQQQAMVLLSSMKQPPLFSLPVPALLAPLIGSQLELRSHFAVFFLAATLFYAPTLDLVDFCVGVVGVAAIGIEGGYKRFSDKVKNGVPPLLPLDRSF
jgi:hypothetical protein